MVLVCNKKVNSHSGRVKSYLLFQNPIGYFLEEGFFKFFCPNVPKQGPYLHVLCVHCVVSKMTTFFDRVKKLFVELEW